MGAFGELAYIDGRVYAQHGLSELHSAISAQAAAVGTILALVAALVGVGTYLRPEVDAPPEAPS